LLQQAIVSRCIVTIVPAYTGNPKVEGSLDPALWDDPRKYEMELEAASK
jgi:hypothetical protein